MQPCSLAVCFTVVMNVFFKIKSNPMHPLSVSKYIMSKSIFTHERVNMREVKSFSYLLFVLFHSSCPYAQVFGTTLVHELYISYSYTVWIFLFTRPIVIPYGSFSLHVL